MPFVGTIVHYYEKIGQTIYDPVVTNEFVQYHKERMKRGEISSYRLYLLAAEKAELIIHDRHNFRATRDARHNVCSK